MINSQEQQQCGETTMADDDVPSNVVPFPGQSKNRPPQNMDEILRSVAMAKTTRIDEVTEEVIVNMFEDLYGNNYDFTDRQDTNKDMAFLIEALKSMLHRHDGLGHPFHALAEKQFEADENGDLAFIIDEVEMIIEITDVEENE